MQFERSIIPSKLRIQLKISFKFIIKSLFFKSHIIEQAKQ